MGSIPHEFDGLASAPAARLGRGARRGHESAQVGGAGVRGRFGVGGPPLGEEPVVDRSCAVGVPAGVLVHAEALPVAAGNGRPYYAKRPSERPFGRPPGRVWCAVSTGQLLPAPLPERIGMSSRMCERASSPLAWVEFSVHCWFCGEDRTLMSWTEIGTTPSSEPTLALAGRAMQGLFSEPWMSANCGLQ